MTRKELIEKLLAVGNDDSEVKDLLTGEDPLEITGVSMGRTVDDGEGDYEVDEDVIFIEVTD